MLEKLQPLERHPVGVGGDGDDVLHADNGSGECGVGNGDILAVGEDDDALPTNDDSTTTLIIGTIRTDSNLGVGDVLAAIGISAIGAIYGSISVAIDDGGGSNLDADALRVGGDDGTDVLLGNRTTVVLADDDRRVWQSACPCTRCCRGRVDFQGGRSDRGLNKDVTI
jgi:hypothetical protein